MAETSNMAGSTRGRHKQSYSNSSTSSTQKNTDAFLTRRELRQREQCPSGRRVGRLPATGGRSKKVRGAALNVVVITFATGLVATMALPAYAFLPAKSGDDVPRSSSDIRGVSKAQPQTDGAASSAVPASIARDGYATRSVPVVDADAEQKRAEAARQLAPSSAGSGVPAPAAMQSASGGLVKGDIVAYARYLVDRHTRYVNGGESLDGVDCSGLVKLVFAQFGVKLPHSAAGQAALGTRISESEAVPGDVVHFPGIGHVGIYVGGGRIIHSPDVGLTVTTAPIFAKSHYFVRLIDG